MNIEDWNKIKKPSNVDVKAEDGDIVEKVNGVLYLLQTNNGYNNIIAYRVEPSDKFIVWTLLEYCILIYEKYNIKYVRVEGDKGKYRFLERNFSRNIVRKDKNEKERDVYYCNLEKAYKVIKLRCQEYEFYYTQDLYLKSTDTIQKKKYFDKMFFMVQFAVENALKKMFDRFERKGAIRPNASEDLYDFTISATTNIMSRYKRPEGYKILYLLTTANYAALGVLHNKRQQFWDKQISYEALERYEYVEE